MKSKAFLFSMVLTLIAPAAFAGGAWTNVTVSAVQPCTAQGCSPNGYIEVELSANSTGSPACAVNYKNWVAIDSTTASGAFAAAVLQSARLSGTTVTLSGTGACSINSGIETLSLVTE